MSALARALLLAIPATLVVWAFTLDWSGGFGKPVALTAPWPGLAVGLIVAVGTLLLPASGSGPAGKGGKSGRRGLRRTALLAALGALIILGIIGWKASDRYLTATLADLGDRLRPAEAPGRPADEPPAPSARPASARRAAAPTPETESENSQPVAVAPTWPSTPARPATATMAPAPAPTPAGDPKRYELTALTYELYPETGVGSLNLAFRDRQLNRPALAYYDLIRDTSTITIMVSASLTQAVGSTPRDGLVNSISQATSGDRLQLIVRLAQPEVGIVDDTQSRQTGIHLFFVPGAGFGSLSHAPTPRP